MDGRRNGRPRLGRLREGEAAGIRVEIVWAEPGSAEARLARQQAARLLAEAARKRGLR